MIADHPGDENIPDKYICPENGCNLIPEILGVYCESGSIVFKCSNGHTTEIDVEEYLKLNEQRYENAEGDNIDNEGEISEADILGSKKSIKSKIELLTDIIKAHEQIIQTQELYPENYFHNQNILNIADFIKEEKEVKIPRDNDENETIRIDDIIKEIESKREKEDENIKKLAKEYGVQLDKEKHIKSELNLVLKGPKTEGDFIKLSDGGFKLLSQIIFKNLIGLNLANNEIKDISPLDNMLLPHLETIDLSNNKIEDIKPVANLACEYLNEIYLHNNQIEDLGPFLEPNFNLDNLEFLRVDGNKKAMTKDINNNNNNNNNNNDPYENFIKVKLKYKSKIMTEPPKWDNFAKKYNYYIGAQKNNLNAEDYLNHEKFDLASRRNGEILKDLCPLIIYPNKIKYLIMDDNKLENVSLLRRMPLYNLVELDLSLNFITNIKFLKKMTKNWKRLQKLYLNDNKINDISPFEKYGIDEDKKTFPSSLTILSLKNNCLDLNDSITYNILETLINNPNLTFDYEMKNLNPEENNEAGTTGNTQ